MGWVGMRRSSLYNKKKTQYFFLSFLLLGEGALRGMGMYKINKPVFLVLFFPSLPSVPCSAVENSIFSSALPSIFYFSFPLLLLGERHARGVITLFRSVLGSYACMYSTFTSSSSIITHPDRKTIHPHCGMYCLSITST